MIYTLHALEPPADGDRDGGMIAVPERTAVWALIAPLLWLLVHRLWWALAFYTLVALTFLILLGSSFWGITLALGGLPGLYLYLEGNELRRARLRRHGYQMVGVADAPDGDLAVARFVSHRDRFK